MQYILNELEKAAVDAHSRLSDGEGLSFYNIFKAGAEWQRSHVWHSPDETPDNGKRVLIEWKSDNCTDIFFYFYDTGHFDKHYMSFCIMCDKLLPTDKVTRWAYIDDILPGIGFYLQNESDTGNLTDTRI